jgi:integrase
MVPEPAEIVLAPGVQAITDGRGTTIIRPMLTIDRAIDLFLSDLSRRGRAERTRTSYRRILDLFADRFPHEWDAGKVTEDEISAFIDQWVRRGRKPGTLAQVHAPLNGLFRFLYRTRRIKRNPMEFIPPPTRQSAGDVDVVRVSPLDVPRLLREARPGTERNAVAIVAYLGPRRRAAALVRLRDYDRRTGEITFHEKGGKTITKPVPAELAQILSGSIARGEIWPAPNDYLVPPEAPPRGEERDDRIVWRAVRRVAARAGVRAHVHALRAAFAEFYVLSNPGDVYGAQHLLGHDSPETTETHYLSRAARRVAMEPVRTLAWLGNDGAAGNPQTAGDRYASLAGVGAEGFEPSSDALAGAERAGRQPEPTSLEETLLGRVDELVRETLDTPRKEDPVA